MQTVWDILALHDGGLGQRGLMVQGAKDAPAKRRLRRPEDNNGMDTIRDRSGVGHTRALFLLPLGHLAIEIYNTMLSVMWPLFAAQFGLAYGAVGLLSTLYRTTMTLPQLGFAALADRRGSRGLAICGLAWMAVGMSLVGVAPNVAILALVLALAPLGSAAYHPAGTAYMSRTLPRRRGTSVALFMIGGTLGCALGPLIGAWLYGRHGVGTSPWLMPMGLLMAAVIAVLIPGDRPAAGIHTPYQQTGGRLPPAVLLLVAISVCISWMENSITAYLPLYYTGRALSLGLASQALFAFSTAAAGGIFLGGTLSDRVPRWRILLVGQVLTLPLHLGMVLARGPWLVLAPAALGFASSLSHPTLVALAQEMMPQRTSLAAALTMGVSWVLGSFGAMATGFLADYLGMQQALLLNTGLPMIGAICVLAVRHVGRPVRTPIGANVVALPRHTLKGDV